MITVFYAVFRSPQGSVIQGVYFDIDSAINAVRESRRLVVTDDAGNQIWPKPRDLSISYVPEAE